MKYLEASDAIGCAQTNVQLYRQLSQAGWRKEDLLRARRGYELATELFAGRFRPMGKPFVCHLVGVASLLERFGASTRAVLAGVVHSAYPQGDFGTGHQGPLPSHRQRVRNAIGPEAEQLVERYASWKDDGGVSTIDRRIEDGHRLEEAEREVLLIDLMDTLEEHHDYGILFCRKAGSDEKRNSRIASSVEIANLIDRPDLAEELGSTIGRVYETEFPTILVADHKHSFTLGAPPQRRSRVTRALRDPRSVLHWARQELVRRRA